MKNKLTIHLCFLVPFVITVLNLQVLVTMFISTVLAQIIAYFCLGLILLGIVLTLRNRGEFSRTARLWIYFYIIYFVIAIFSGAMHNNYTNIVASTIPFFYVIGFYYYLSLPENRKVFEKTAIISLILSCLTCIYFNSINFDLDVQGVGEYVVDRAQGVYGDANNMALVTVLTFIFIYKVYNPQKIIFKILKIGILAVVFYSLFITFSTTGLSVFIISLVILNSKFFTGLKLIFGICLLPIVYLLLLNLNSLTANMDLVGQQRDKINNLVNVLSLNFEEIDDSGRSELVAEVLHYIYKNPLMGNGVDFGALHQTHNTFIAIWADAGIFVLLFFIIMLGVYYRRAFSCSENIRYFVLPMLLAMCVFMLSLHSVINQPYLMAIFVYLGYLIDDETVEFT
ncbi:O-antigen ligase family protein [Winogradskyella sediminis]|uniref:O-antigen ligase n=1 Tax=Winogradskyella sediminis TaxID=1382466 RepID=A0A1H1LRK4_9FLAO|nr:O-antigen ligase family protein [Winogradskyella sediminis]SDR76655.1 O-antigen ligase [Winogradskyella sediminis]